jgi:hypothetical protein
VSACSSSRAVGRRFFCDLAVGDVVLAQKIALETMDWKRWP